MIRRGLLAWAAFATALLLILAGRGRAEAEPFFLLPPFAVPTLAIAAVGVLLGGAVTWCATGYAEPVEGRRRIGYAALLPIVGLAGVLLIADAVPVLSAPRAAAALLLGTLAIAAGRRCVDLLGSGDPIGFESHWGGLGGGAAGWRLFPATGLAILTLSFAGSALTILVLDPTARGSHPAATPPEGVAASSESVPAAKPGARTDGADRAHPAVPTQPN